MDKLPKFQGTVASQGQGTIFDSASGQVDKVMLASRLETLKKNPNAVDADKSNDSGETPKKE